ncbi:hypothetical protein ACOME3_008854 [Neoechinorhynchus agilis]
MNNLNRLNNYENASATINPHEQAATEIVRIPGRRQNPWGFATYAELIQLAITTSAEQRLTLQEIYNWMISNVEYFASMTVKRDIDQMKNSIRHNLSHHDQFVRVVSATGCRASYWTYDPNNIKERPAKRPRVTQENMNAARDGRRPGRGRGPTRTRTGDFPNPFTTEIHGTQEQLAPNLYQPNGNNQLPQFGSQTYNNIPPNTFAMNYNPWYQPAQIYNGNFQPNALGQQFEFQHQNNIITQNAMNTQWGYDGTNQQMNNGIKINNTYLPPANLNTPTVHTYHGNYITNFGLPQMGIGASGPMGLQGPMTMPADPNSANQSTATLMNPVGNTFQGHVNSSNQEGFVNINNETIGQTNSNQMTLGESVPTGHQVSGTVRANPFSRNQCTIRKMNTAPNTSSNPDEVGAFIDQIIAEAKKQKMEPSGGAISELKEPGAEYSAKEFERKSCDKKNDSRIVHAGQMLENINEQGSISFYDQTAASAQLRNRNSNEPALKEEVSHSHKRALDAGIQDDLLPPPAKQSSRTIKSNPMEGGVTFVNAQAEIYEWWNEPTEYDEYIRQIQLNAISEGDSAAEAQEGNSFEADNRDGFRDSLNNDWLTQQSENSSFIDQQHENPSIFVKNTDILRLLDGIIKSRNQNNRTQ